ncbi:MAG: nuclease-related domain-containing protein [Janthinobacterium lividum]
MKVLRHPRHADKIMRIEGTLAVAGVGGGTLLWTQAAHFGGYAFAAAAFLSLGGVQAGVRALRNYNRYHRGSEGEESVLQTLRGLPDAYTAIANFVAPGTHQGDMDLLVLGPAGVLVIEVKSYTGRYACHGDTWFSVHPDGTRCPLRGSVSRQLKRAGKSVAHYLVDCDISVPIHTVAVFRAGVELDLTRPTVPIIQQETLRDYVQNLPAAPRSTCASDLEPLFVPIAPVRRSYLPLLSR